MKKSHIYLLLLSCLFFAFSCNGKKPKEESNAAAKPEVNKEHLISEEEARKYYLMYERNNYALINKDRATKQLPVDSRSYWFSISELEAYLQYVKDNYPGEVDPNKLGIRVYLGTYPEGEKIKGQDVSNYENVFFYPTYADKDIFKNATDTLQNRSASMIIEANLGYNRGMMSPPN